jgi:hypothetical protein
MDWLVIDEDASRDPTTPDWPVNEIHWHWAVMRSDSKPFTVAQEND